MFKRKALSIVLLLTVFLLPSHVAGQDAVPEPAPAETTAPPEPVPAATETPAPPEPAPTPPPASEVIAEAVKQFDPKKSYTRLAHPAVAARMGLSTAQQGEVQRLIALRAQELAKATEDKWTGIIVESEQKLADVLTPAQKTLWPRLFEEKTLRIIAKDQPWADVLRWFAQQAGYQLIMDAPPPGTLTYVEQNDLTVTEAIDKMNGFLQMQGYTLVRNDRTLMLFNLKRGRIPVQFLPKLRPEELQDRGRFEYTTVMFSLERRDRAAVLALVEPFKGDYCNVLPMPGNSLMITDTVNNLLVLQKVIESVENPPAPDPPKQPVTPEPPEPAEWNTYLIEKNDPAKIEAIFKEFVPVAKILRIGSSRELHVSVTKSQHASLKQILEMLEKDTGVTDGQQVLATYSLAPYLNATPQQFYRVGRLGRGLAASMQGPQPVQQPWQPQVDMTSLIGKEIIDLLKKTFPAAIISDTSVAGNIVVFAPQTDQDKIKSFFESLKQRSVPEDEPTVKMYRYSDAKKKMNEETRVSLQAVVPTGLVILDDQSGQILVVATAKEHEMLSKMVTELDAIAVPVADRIVKTYPIPSTLANAFASMLRQMTQQKELEGIVELHSNKQNRVTILATAEHHEKIRQMVEGITGRKSSADPSEKSAADPILKAFPMIRGSAYTAQTVLSDVVQDVELTFDQRSNAVVAFGPPAMVDLVEKGVAELDRGIDDEVIFVKMARELPQPTLSQLYRAAPRSAIIQSRRTKQIIAVGPKQELEKIRAVLTAAENIAVSSDEVVVHTLNSVAPQTVIDVLTEIFPDVRVIPNPANDQIVLQLPGELKEPVDSLIKQLDGELDFISLKKELTPELLQSIRTMAPRATIVVDKENAQAMLKGSAADVVKIKQIIASTEAATPIAEEVYIHTFKSAYPYFVVTILQEVYPDVKVAGYPTHNQLAVRFRPEMKEKLLKLFDEVDGDIAVVPLKQDIAPTMRATFGQVAPYAAVVVDPQNLQAIIYGPKSDIEKIQTLIKASESAAVDNSDEIYVHTFRSATALQAAVLLHEISPDIRVIGNPVDNQLTLRLKPEQKEKVLKMLEDLDGDIAFIPLKKELSADVRTAFPTVAPNARVIVDEKNALVMVYGTKPDVEKIKTIISTTESAMAVEDAVIVHTLKHVTQTSLISILTEIYPEAKVKDDAENGRVIIRIRPDKKDAAMTLLTQLDIADPDKEKRYFRAYPLETGFYSIDAGYNRYSPVLFVQDIQKLAPRAKVSFDENQQQLIVWGTDEDHRIIDAAVKNLNQDGNGKKFGRFQLRHIDPYAMMMIINRMYPAVIPSLDWSGNAVIVEGHPRLVKKIEELIAVLDPAEPGPSDPIVKFYALNGEPTDSLVAALKQVAPRADIVPDKAAKQVMVIARPAEQKIIETSVKEIIATFTPPEEPVLVIYPATPDQKTRLTAFLRTAAKDLKDVLPIPDDTPNQISIWANPTDHKMIAMVLKQMLLQTASSPNMQLKVFQMSIGDMKTAQEILKVSHPDATTFEDAAGFRLLVWGTAEALEKVTKTLQVQGNLDSRQMLPYPIAGTKPEQVMKVIQDVYQGLKMTPDMQTRRLFVWATPEEHVKIAEIVEQVNKDGFADSNLELAEKFVAYSAANINVMEVRRLFQTMIPDTDIFADADSEKIIVRARKREHEQIKMLLDQLREKDDRLRSTLAVYPFGDTDPTMIEAMLRSLLPNVQSMTSDDIVYRLSYSFMYERYPWYGPSYQQTQTKSGFFKVDPQTQSVYVFVNGEAQKEVETGIKQLIEIGNQEGQKLIVKRYSLDEMSFWDVSELLHQIAPSARFESIYTYVPRSQSSDEESYYDYRSSYGDFLAYAREAEHIKIEAFVSELNDHAGSGHKTMASVALPEGTRQSRKAMIDMIKRLYPDATPSSAAEPNRILVWAKTHQLEKVKKLVEEACLPIPDNQQTILKSYPLRFITVAEATRWVKTICPNAIFEPESVNQGVAPTPPLTEEARRIRLTNQPITEQIIVVIATPIEHVEIAKVLAELDQDVPPDRKPVPRHYSLAEFPESAFEPLYGSLFRAFANIAITPSFDRQTLMIVATEDEHKQVIDFIKAFREDRESQRPRLEIYMLTRSNFPRVQPVLSRIAPSASITPGSTPNIVQVWGIPQEQQNIVDALTKLEAAPLTKPGEESCYKIYRVGGRKAQLTASVLASQFPGAIAFAWGQDELFAWGSPADHEEMAKMIGHIGEAFAEPYLKPYFLKHIPLNEAHSLLIQAFPYDATVQPRMDTGDLIVHATKEIHEKIEKAIAGFDIPRPADVERMPVAYDLSDLPIDQINYAVQSISSALLPQTIILPGATPAQIVVWARSSEQLKVRAVIDEMLKEHPHVMATLQTYSIKRQAAANTFSMLKLIAPQAQITPGASPNQLIAWAREQDHKKLREAIDRINRDEVKYEIEAYSLKNTYSYGARTLLDNLVETYGLDVATVFDLYSNRIFVMATPEDHKTIAALLDKVRTEERFFEAYPLDVLDPQTAYSAIYALFIDETYYTAPGLEIDENTGMIFVQGTKEQHEKTRNLLINMGETRLKTVPQAQDTNIQIPQIDPATSDPVQKPRVRPSGGQLRVLPVEGNIDDIIRELEKVWPTYQQNKLRVIRLDQPLIQQKEPSTGFFSLSDDGDTLSRYTGDKTDSGNETEASLEKLKKMLPSVPAVYVTVNDDGTLTAASYDTAALDQLEKILTRINERVVMEGRDYTIFSVRNISATEVAKNLRLILRDRFQPGQRRYGTASYNYSALGVQPAQLFIQENEQTNTIYVKGSKAERKEVGSLIAILDVSELPGERMVRKPIKVSMKNTDATRVVQQVYNVYQYKIQATRLPGGMFPRVTPNTVNNSVEIIAPEPLATELKEYAEEIDRQTVEEPARKIHVIPLEVKGEVIQSAIDTILQMNYGGYNYGGYPMMAPAMNYSVPRRMAY